VNSSLFFFAQSMVFFGKLSNGGFAGLLARCESRWQDSLTPMVTVGTLILTRLGGSYRDGALPLEAETIK
jgi:hypothetical protein